MTALRVGSERLGLVKRSDIRRFGLLALLAAGVGALGFLVPGFYSPENVTNLLRQTSILGIVALGQTVVLLVSGVDLSVGAVIGLTVMTVPEFTHASDALIPMAVVVVMVLAAAVGLTNGLLITKRSVPPFAATLGMGVLVEGARLAYTHGYPSATIPPGIRPLGLITFGPFPLVFVIFLALAFALWFALSRTTYGRRVYAIGLSPKVARLAGVNVDRVVISVYVLCSLTAAVAGLVLTGWIGYVDKYVGRDFAFDSITVAVVGGTSFAGGQGGIIGSLFGALFLMLILNLVVLLGVDPNAQLVVKAIIVLVAVYFAEARRRSTVRAG